jgi:hypothetical protein
LCATNCLRFIYACPASPNPGRQRVALDRPYKEGIPGRGKRGDVFLELSGCRMRYNCDRVSELSRDARAFYRRGSCMNKQELIDAVAAGTVKARPARAKPLMPFSRP